LWIRQLRKEIRPMVQVKDLIELTVKDLWREVKDEEGWWGEVKPEVLRLVKVFMESAMERELFERLHAARYKRTESRRGYRNGYRSRTLLTELGLMEDLRVPRDRDGIYQPTMLVSYQRRQERVNGLIRECFLGGISTRRVGEVLGSLLGEQPSAQTVSRVVQSLDAEVAAFHRRQLVDGYRYLLLDGITLKVKGGIEVKKRFVLCAYGITAGGSREMISFRQAHSESEAQWEAFLGDLYRRGLCGATLSLIVTDGCPGLGKALQTTYPYVPRQRCWAHKLRNVANQVRRRDQKECLKEARAIYLAPHRTAAIRSYRLWDDKWRLTYPAAVACLEKDLDELLNFFDTPVEHRIKVRTTNVIERAFREVRRRTRPMSCFVNAPSVDRIIYGVIHHLNQHWKENPYREFTHET
jgi:putative transposase